MSVAEYFSATLFSFPAGAVSGILEDERDVSRYPKFLLGPAKNVL